MLIFKVQLYYYLFFYLSLQSFLSVIINGLDQLIYTIMLRGFECVSECGLFIKDFVLRNKDMGMEVGCL